MVKPSTKSLVYRTILEHYRMGKPLYIAEISWLTNLSLETVTKAVYELRREGKVDFYYHRNRKYVIPATSPTPEYTKHRWSDEEDIALRELNDLTWTELSLIFKRSKIAIQSRRNLMGLKKKPSHLPKYLAKILAMVEGGDGDA